MTKVFYKESRLFRTEEAVKDFAKNYISKNYDVIETSKTFDEFEDEYDNLKSEGNSDLDAIEGVK